jgi:menaquinone-dependent protoporphyrinogen oxidase
MPGRGALTLSERCSRITILGAFPICGTAMTDLRMREKPRKLLLVYGTSEGQTRRIADFIADGHRAADWVVTMLEARLADAELRVHEFDAVIVAASLHLGSYQGPVVHFVRERHQALNEMHSAFVSVSLSAAGSDAHDREGLAQCASSFLHETGWQPKMIHHAAGAFHWREYGVLKRWLLRYVAWRRDVPAVTNRDREFTDWERLEEFVDLFLKRATLAEGQRTETQLMTR